MVQAEINADKEKYGYSDEEWELYLESTKNDKKYPISMRLIGYNLIYEIKDKSAVTVKQRDEIMKSVVKDMQKWMEKQKEAKVFEEGFKQTFAAKLKKVIAKHSIKEIIITGDVTREEGFR